MRLRIQDPSLCHGRSRLGCAPTPVRQLDTVMKPNLLQRSQRKGREGFVMRAISQLTCTKAGALGEKEGG